VARACENLYRRFGSRYFEAYIAFDLGSSALLPPIALGALALYVDMSLADFLRILAVLELGLVAGILLGGWQSRRTGAPLFAWIDGGRPAEGAPEAWRAAVAMQHQYVWITIAWVLALGVVPGLAVAAIELDIPAYGVGTIYVGALLVTAYSTMMHFFLIEPVLEPILRDVSQRMHGEIKVHQVRVPLRRKLLAGLPLITLIAGAAASVLATRGEGSLADLGFGLLGALAVTVTLALLLVLLVANSVLDPLRELVEAMRRVRAGDLSTRASVAAEDEMGMLTTSFNEMMDGLAEREALQEAFGSYVSPDAAQRVLRGGSVIEGEEAEVTIMFLDIRDFTSFAERHDAPDVVAFLNEFFGVVVPVITAHGGYVNRIMGDGLLAVFGAPEALPNHAEHAVASALEIADRVKETQGDSLRIGIGLNSGPVVAGTITGGPKLEYTVTGDAVNVASRVEGLTKRTGDTVLCTETTRRFAGASASLEARGELAVQGKTEPLRVYEVTSSRGALTSASSE
jgi:adenylate cyclase